jgi:hypothetical protein
MRFGHEHGHRIRDGRRAILNEEEQANRLLSCLADEAEPSPMRPSLQAQRAATTRLSAASTEPRPAPETTSDTAIAISARPNS